jgi:AbiA family abortive infection protein
MCAMPTNTSQPGYFISFRLWTEAIRLLQFQLDQKQVNRHFNTLSMFYYENLGDSVNILTTEEYYNQRIASGLFYGFRKEFAVYSYPIPKSRLGLREYKFFTYPMRIAYYSYVLYLLLISQGFVQSHYENRPNIRSFYGGDIVFDDEDRLILNRSAVYYREHYKHFRDEVRRECEQDHKNKIVMRLDITSYFDNISMPILLKMLDDCVLPTTKRQHSFDTNTQQQIVQFFQFVSNSQIGIPQSDNDVASSYIGFLYLIFAEL